jgi:hypothetical protein
MSDLATLRQERSAAYRNHRKIDAEAMQSTAPWIEKGPAVLKAEYECRLADLRVANKRWQEEQPGQNPLEIKEGSLTDAVRNALLNMDEQEPGSE